MISIRYGGPAIYENFHRSIDIECAGTQEDAIQLLRETMKDLVKRELL